MKWASYLIAIATLFIGAVVFKILFAGVELPDRPMAKWSQVENGKVAGQKVARFMYPLVNQYRELKFAGSSAFAEGFKESFVKEIERIAQLRMRTSKTFDESFVIHFIAYDVENLRALCDQGQKPACVAQRSGKKLKKKNPEPNQTWFRMDRLSQTEALVTFKPSSP